MLKRRPQRIYYRNGQLRLEQAEVEGELHGHSRAWHCNGQIAEETFYSHGKMHGICRQWNDNGRLLGSFSVQNGTGKHRYWHQNGSLRLEMDLMDGKFHGRLRTWLSDGTLIQETFFIANSEVPRAAYLKAACANPAWPQYIHQAAGRVAREGASLKRKEHDLFIESLLLKSRAEAHYWLSQEKASSSRSLSGFRTSKAVLRFIDALYAAGAKYTFVVPVYQDKFGYLFADNLVIELPKNATKRKSLRSLCEPLCRMNRAAMLPETDIGESHLFLGLE